MTLRVFLKRVFPVLFCLSWSAAFAENVVITPDNSSQILFVGGKLNLACRIKNHSLGVLSDDEVKPGVVFKEVNPRRWIHRLRKRIDIFRAVRRSLRGAPARRVKRLTQKIDFLRGKVREVAAARRVCASSQPGRLARAISQYGITWIFDREYEVGQYINGDWWVVGPVVIESINPSAAGRGEGLRNGSMINPVPERRQSYDGRNYWFSPELLESAPIELLPGQSLVSSVSLVAGDLAGGEYLDLMGYDVVRNNGTWWATYTKSAAILTCVEGAPPADAFRPPYVGSSKPLFTRSQLRWENLRQLPAPAEKPPVPVFERYFQRPWIDHLPGWVSRAMHPADNMPNYGRELATMIGDAALLLCLDLERAEKEKILIGLVQVGIDNYHQALLNKRMWTIDGGHMMGRKFPILFAGLMLGRPEMLTLRDYASQEDLATYFGGDGEHLWTGWQNSAHPYAADVMYTQSDQLDTSGHSYNWEHLAPSAWHLFPFPNNGMFPFDKHEGYRRLVAPSLAGEAIAARILGLKSAWSHEPFFAYVDRWVYEDDGPNISAITAAAAANDWSHLVSGDWSNPKSWFPVAGDFYSRLAEHMYLTYRPQY